LEEPIVTHTDEATDAKCCAAVLVTYHPEIEVLFRVLEATIPQVDRVILVDNGSPADLENALGCLPFADRITFRSLGRNFGIAHAQNRGIEELLSAGYESILVLDQDSIPTAGMVGALSNATREATRQGLKVAAAGPRYVDPRTGNESFFLSLGRWRFRKLACTDASTGSFLAADWLISSGTLLPAAALREIGLMREDLFIDDVDTEWCLRAKSKGWQSIGACEAVMEHTLGARTVRVRLNREHDVPVHSPVRLYYMVRNGLALARMPHVPWNWWVPNMKRLIFMLVLFSFFIPPRLRNFRMMLRGAWDGIIGVSGPYDRPQRPA
jgi:rhamnosyltransferase